MRQREVNNRENNCNKSRGLFVECGRNTERFLSRLVTLVAVPFLVIVFTTCYALDVSAYSATLTTGTDIKLNASPSGDGTSIHEESINVVSDCRAGYNLSIATPEGSNLYTNGDDSTTAVFTAVDGTSALNSTNNTNKWGYTLTTNPTSSTVFSPLSTTPSILKTVSQTASSNSDINDTFSINYGVKVDNTIAPGSYKMANNGTIVYYLTMATTCNSYIVQYQGNNADNPNGMGTTDSSTGEKSVKQINIERDTKITLLPANFKKAGYGFLGWSTDSDAYTHFTDNDNTNDPIIYGPMEDVVIDSTIVAAANNRNQINMYAVWVPALKDGSNNTVYFQDWDNPNTTLPNDGCSTLTQTVFDDTITNEKGKITVTKNSFVALTDKRDNEVYTVARLADGNCWMTENLRLEHEGTVGNNINNPTVTNRSLAQGYNSNIGTYGSFIGLAEPETTFYYDEGVPNSFYKGDGSGDTYNATTGTLEDVVGVGGYLGYAVYDIPRYNNSNTSDSVDSSIYIQDYADTSSPSESGTNYRSSSNVYGYGNYYSFSAAIANTGIGASDVSGTSICPSGWGIPSSNINGVAGEIGLLSQGYGGSGRSQNSASNGEIISGRFRSFPNNFLYSGFLMNSSMGSRGLYGSYWSKMPGMDDEGVYLLYDENIFVPSERSSRSIGRTVRCFTKPNNVIVAIDSNNGSGYTGSLYGNVDSTINLPNDITQSNGPFGKPGYYLSGWNTAPNGSGTSYTSSFTIPAGSTGETLYAQWTPQYNITYVNNCKTYASANSYCTQGVSDHTLKQRVALASVPSTGTETATLGAYNKFTMTGWKITGWTTNADGTGTEYKERTTYTVPSGSSAGSGIILYAHWVPIYTVQYDGNGSDNDNTGMGSTNATTGIKSVAHTNVGEGDTFDLFASNFKKAGYGFVGWSTDANAWAKLTDNDSTNDAKIWGPNEIFTAPAPNGTPITTLYAVWAPAETSGGNPVYLQGWTGCSAMTATTYDTNTGTLTVAKDSVTALTDERDGNVYAIAKLADENCWMIENLRLADTHDESGSTVATTLTTSNTNIDTNNNTLPITNIYNADSSLATKSNSLSPSSSVTYNASSAPYGWCTYQIYSTACYNQSSLNTTNTVSNTTPSKTQSITSANAHSDFSTTIYAYGNYYNWYSATAGYGTAGKSSGNVGGDLCPAGWKLPYGSAGTGTGGGKTKGGFYYLADQMGTASRSNKFRMFPNNFIYSGYWEGSSAAGRGNSGSYWSASAVDRGYAYHLLLDPSYVYPSNDYDKYSGYSVRCVTSF